MQHDNSPGHWATLCDAIRSGAVQGLGFNGVDLSTLGADSFLPVVGCRGLQSLKVRRSVLPNGFVTDDLIRSSAARGVLQLSSEKNSDAPSQLSDKVILDFFFQADVAPCERESLRLVPEGYGVDETFLKRFFEVSTFVVLFPRQFCNF